MSDLNAKYHIFRERKKVTSHYLEAVSLCRLDGLDFLILENLIGKKLVDCKYQKDTQRVLRAQVLVRCKLETQLHCLFLNIVAPLPNKRRLKVEGPKMKFDR